MAPVRCVTPPPHDFSLCSPQYRIEIEVDADGRVVETQVRDWTTCF